MLEVSGAYINLLIMIEYYYIALYVNNKQSDLCFIEIVVEMPRFDHSVDFVTNTLLEFDDVLFVCNIMPNLASR